MRGFHVEETVNIFSTWWYYLIEIHRFTPTQFSCLPIYLYILHCIASFTKMFMYNYVQLIVLSSQSSLTALYFILY